MVAKQKLRLTDRCTRQCSMNPSNLSYFDELHLWFEAKRPLEWMVAESATKDRKLSLGALSRHRKHLEDDDSADIDEVGDGQVDHLKVLQKIIAVGAKRAHTWRIGPTETLKAMDMYYRLTQGSAMQDLFSALSAAAANEDSDEQIEDPAAAFTDAELATVEGDSG